MSAGTTGRDSWGMYLTPARLPCHSARKTPGSASFSRGETRGTTPVPARPVRLPPPAAGRRYLGGLTGPLRGGRGDAVGPDVVGVHHPRRRVAAGSGRPGRRAGDDR